MNEINRLRKLGIIWTDHANIDVNTITTNHVIHNLGAEYTNKIQISQDTVDWKQYGSPVVFNFLLLLTKSQDFNILELCVRDLKDTNATVGWMT